MSVFLKKFSTHSEYEQYINSSGAILPNVSICTTERDVHYNPKTKPQETRVVAKFNVTDTSNPTQICGYEESFDPEFEPSKDYSSGFTSIEIDGVILPTVSYQHQFDTLGEHTVKYTLLDPTSIGEMAFYNCSSLTSIDIPSGVTSIGDGAFYNCSSLTSIDIPSGVTSIGVDAFFNCSSFTSITVDSSNTVYDSRNNCNAIIETSTNILIKGCKNTVIPDSVTSIGNWAFHLCIGLTSIEIPDSVTSIGTGVFQMCSGLTSITIPNSVTSIGNQAFYNCSSLTSIDIPSGVTSIGQSAFYNCRSLTSIDIPSGVTSIGQSAFYNCRSLTSIVSNATTPPTLGSSAFSYTNDCPIYVPSASVETYKSASRWSIYADRIQAIP